MRITRCNICGYTVTGTPEERLTAFIRHNEAAHAGRAGYTAEEQRSARRIVLGLLAVTVVYLFVVLLLVDSSGTVLR